MAKRITRIVLTGGPAAGKTTLISRILKEFKQDDGWKVITIPETATELISGFGICVLRIVWITCFLGADSHLNMVLYSYPISWAFTSLLFLIYYLRGNWLKKRIYETSLSL